MPVVSLEDLGVMAGALQPSQPGHISLLLFHAVLFSSSHFVNIEVLHDLRFRTRRQACSHFYSNTMVSLKDPFNIKTCELIIGHLFVPSATAPAGL